MPSPIDPWHSRCYSQVQTMGTQAPPPASSANALLAPAMTDPRSPAYTAGIPRLPVLKALTSARFFAALHVALYHLIHPFKIWGIFAPVMSAGYTGVSFFFVLSGFILTYAHGTEYEAGRGNAQKFWIARFARIYPVYLFVTVAGG